MKLYLKENKTVGTEGKKRLLVPKNGETKLELRKLLGIRSEVGNILEKFIDEFEVLVVESATDLQSYGTNVNEDICHTDTLLIAATDATIALGKEYGIATMAYVNLEIPDQTYSGVDMIVEGFEEVDVNFLEKVYQRYHHIPWKIAETERCVIRELALDDLDKLFELYADEEITKYTEGLYPYEEEREFQTAYINNMYRFYGYGMWLVFSKETGELIGRAGLEHREYNGETELELGYVIGTRFQQQGYATEVCSRIIEVAKEVTDFSRINCLIEAENEASIGLVEKLGFAQLEDMELDGKLMKRYLRKMS